MGMLQDLLKEVPLSSVLRERVALAEQRYELAVEELSALKRRVAELEKENAEFRAQVPAQPAGDLGADTARVLAYLFNMAGGDHELDVGIMAQTLKMARGVLQYHLDRLHEKGLADVAGFNTVHGHVYWALTTKGRSHAVENGLI